MEDERRETRRLRDLRGRMKTARAVVSTAPGLSEILRRDWGRAALFYSRFGIAETLYRGGVTPQRDAGDQLTEPLTGRRFGMTKLSSGIRGRFRRRGRVNSGGAEGLPIRTFLFVRPLVQSCRKHLVRDEVQRPQT